MEFTHYYGKHRKKDKVLPQLGVDTKTEILKLRVSPFLKKQIKELSEEKNKTVSEMTRLLWENYFNKVWQKEWGGV